MAYETFAFVYDEVMDSSLYKKWLDFSCRHLGKRKQLLELACGTGALAVEFAKAGFDVTGLDLSEEMLMIASQRAIKQLPAILTPFATWKTSRVCSKCLMVFTVV